MSIPPIKDKYYITYSIFYLLGILTFIPNYFVLTASTYWLFKFRYVGPENTERDPNNSLPGPPAERNMLQASFLSTYFVVTQFSFIAFIILTAAYSKKLPPPEKRITAALLCSLVFYIVNLIFVNIVTDAFQVAFFMLIMCIACFLGISGAVIIVSLFEMVSNFPSEYYSAILTAQALCGVISALIQLLTISLTDLPTTSGLIFFSIGTAMVCTTLTIYTYSKRNSQYFIYHIENDPTTNVVQPRGKFLVRLWKQVKNPFKKTKIYMISLTIVFGTTAIMYPGLMSLVASRRSDGHSSNKWVEFYFIPVITFLVANVCDLLGRYLATKIRKPSQEWVLLTVAILRIAFIPLLMYCNVQPRLHTPVLFSDVHYIIFTIIFMFSNGYLINLSVVIVPTRAQDREEKSLITVMTVLSGVLSTALCSFLSLIVVHIL